MTSNCMHMPLQQAKQPRFCVQGTFHVSAVQPISYVIEEVDGLLDPANKVLAQAVDFLWTCCAETSSSILKKYD